ncbi:MAG: hypothetical protein DI539_11465 [Flavobacterium psychrophilum]|nr:MAG: hypothetical protein DI539_11465 [Flavobacterium psychrophilum]
MFVFSVVSLQAQVKDSLESKNKATAKLITNQFPSTRFLDIQYEQLSGTDYETKLHGKKYETGTVDSEKRLQVAMNAPIIKKDRWVLSTSLRYRYRDISFSNVEVLSGDEPLIGGENSQHFHYFLASVNYTRYDKLFGKTLVSNLSVFGDASNEKFGVANATYIASLVLKKDKRTTLTTGLVVQTNPNSVFPILPAFSYSHQFKDSPWQIDIILPKQIYLRRALLAHGRLSVGTVFDGEPFYFSTNISGNGDKVYNFNRNEIKSGVMYEYKIRENVITYFRTGWNYFLNGTIRERGEVNEISKTTFDSNFYFNLGFSYNLFK